MFRPLDLPNNTEELDKVFKVRGHSAFKLVKARMLFSDFKGPLYPLGTLQLLIICRTERAHFLKSCARLFPVFLKPRPEEEEED